MSSSSPSSNTTNVLLPKVEVEDLRISESIDNVMRGDNVNMHPVQTRDAPPPLPSVKCKVCGSDKNVLRGIQVCGDCRSLKNRDVAGLKCVFGHGKCMTNMLTCNLCLYCRHKKFTEIQESFLAESSTNHDRCNICGKKRVSRYRGLVICQSCKKYYQKHNKSHCLLECSNGDGKCEINMKTRNDCEYCRYKKIKNLVSEPATPLRMRWTVDKRCQNFKKKTRPKIYRYVCAVCEGGAECMHYGVIACDSCAIFFRRNSHEKFPPECTENCKINDQTRSNCKYCRLKKCRELGMMKNGLTPKQAEDVDDRAVTTIEDKPDDVDSQSKNSLDPIYKPFDDRTSKSSETLSAKDVVLGDPHQTPIDLNMSDGSKNNRIDNLEEDLFVHGILDKEDDKIEFRLEETLYNGPDRSALSPCSLNTSDFLSKRTSPGADVNAESTITLIEAVACNEKDDNVQFGLHQYVEPDSPFSNDMEYADHVEDYEEESSVRRSPQTDNDVPTIEDKPDDVDSRTNSNSILADKQLIRSPQESAHSPRDLNIPDSPMNIISSDAREDVKSLISSAQSTPRNELTSCFNDNIPDSSMERASSDGEEDVSMLQLAPEQEHVPCSDNDDLIEHLEERNAPDSFSPETVVAASVNVNRVDEEENNIPGCSSAITTPEVVLMITDNNDNEKEIDIGNCPNDQNPLPDRPQSCESPMKVHFENDSIRNKDEMLINNITDVYKSKCRYFEMKQTRNYLTLNRLYFTIEDPEELKRQWIYLFFREYSHDLEDILSFLNNVPFLKILSTQKIVAQLKKNSFSIWTVWCLYGIGKKKLILPNGRYLDREALRSIFRSKVLGKFFKVPHDFFELDLNPTEISLLIIFLFGESAELAVPEYCWNMLEDIILKRENGDRILIELMKRIEDLKELDGRISRSRRMTQIIDAVRCLK